MGVNENEHNDIDTSNATTNKTEKDYSDQLAEIANIISKQQNRISLWALGVAIISAIISIWGVWASNVNNKNISKDEIGKAHAAKIIIWDQEIDKEIMVDTIITDELLLKYSNIGDGLAQDIKFEILSEEQKNIALRCEELLDSCLTYPNNQETYTFDYDHYLSPDIGDGITFNFWYDLSGGEIGELRSVDILGEYYSFDSSICNSKAYLLPVLEENKETNVVIPKELSLLIFNTLLTVKQYDMSLQNPIVFNIQISYKDVYDTPTYEQAAVELSIIDEQKKKESTSDDSKTSADNRLEKIRLQVTVNQSTIDSSDTADSK